MVQQRILSERAIDLAQQACALLGSLELPPEYPSLSHDDATDEQRVRHEVDRRAVRRAHHAYERRLEAASRLLSAASSLIGQE